MRITKKKWLVYLTLALMLFLSLPVYAEDNPVLEDNPPAVDLAPLDLTVDPVPTPEPSKMMLRSTLTTAGATTAITVRPGESVTQDINVELPALPPRADVIFAFDLTGSMGSIINTAKTNAVNIMNQLNALGIDIDYGVISYMDYPHSYNSYGYSNTYGGGSDYAYRLNSPITADDSAVAAAINRLSLGGGSDGPENYTRQFYESYADPNIAWRDGARKIMVNFADYIPHDNNLNEGITDGIWSTGGDPGRDEIMGTADDLDLQTVLAEMNANHITLLECHSSSGYTNYWNYWTGITGGETYVINSGSLVNSVVSAVNTGLTSPTVRNLRLQAGSNASWVAVSPAVLPEVPTGSTQTFAVTFTVPAGTPQGVYNICLSAIDDKGVNYGDTNLEITVPDVIPPTAEVSYDVKTPTNGNVTATLVNESEPITVTNNDGQRSYTFTDNGSFTFEFQDLAGNTAQATATVDWIDRIPPAAEVSYSESNPTTGQVTATLTNESEPITVTNNGGSRDHSFDANGSFIFEFVDKAGNTGTASATVNWIARSNGKIIIHGKAYGTDDTAIAGFAFDVGRSRLTQKSHPNGLGYVIFKDLDASAGIDIYGPNNLKLIMGDLVSFGMSETNAAQKMACFECRLADKSPLSINGTPAGTILVTLNWNQGSNGPVDILVRIFDGNGSAGGTELYRKSGVIKTGLIISSQIQWGN